MRNLRIIKYMFVAILLFTTIYTTISNGDTSKTLLYVYNCRYLERHLDPILTEFNRTSDTIKRFYLAKNLFKEYGYFQLDTNSNYNLFKKNNNKWYVKIGKKWHLFYYNGINTDFIYFAKTGRLDTIEDYILPPYAKAIISWKDSVCINGKINRVFCEGLQWSGASYSYYIFDPDEGIVGSFGEYIPFTESIWKDTCWRERITYEK